MQIRVRVESVYPQGLAVEFPALMRQLTPYDLDLADKAPTMLELTPLVVRRTHDDAASEAARRIMAKAAPGLEKLTRQVQDQLAGWKLGTTEKTLNQLEDGFLALEAELARAELG